MFRLPLVLACLISVIATLQGTELVVETTHGRVRGTSHGLTKSFRGIPYARPPTGFLRWQPPQPPVSWHQDVLEANSDPPGCPQIGCNPPMVCPTKTSEDCLYLNVFAPVGATNTSGLPVMVYIHGGNFFYMSGASPLYDGEVFVQRGNVVLVNINYRLGALGFLVTGTTEADARGNYGLLDQIYALQWVKSNIRQFGGDPDKVTLFGQSAGAQSTLQHMTSEESSALFRSAIIESSPISLPYKTYNEAYVLGGLLAKHLSCDVADISCLRSKTADEVALAASATRAEVASVKFLEMFEPYGPYVDGTLVKGQPLEAFSQSQFYKKPMIIGTTTEETVLFIYSAWNSPVSLDAFVAVVGAVRPDKVLQILEHYPPSPTAGDQRETMVNISTDLIFECASRNLTRTVASQGQDSIWVYYWNKAISFQGWGQDTFCDGRTCHGSEIVYVFQTAYKANFTMTPEEIVLSDDVIAYWTNFAWSGNPNTRSEAEAKRLQRKRRGASKSGGLARMSIENDERYPSPGDRMLFDKRQLTSSHFKKEAVAAAAPKFWPEYVAQLGWPGLIFQTPTDAVVQNRRAQHCDFWDSIGYSWPT